MSAEKYTRLDPARFQRIAELQDSGQFEDVIRESQAALGETTDPNEQASLLFDGITACQFLNRLGDARRMLHRLKRLEISDVEGRLNAKLCEPSILIDEGKLKEGVAALESMLQRDGELLRQPDFRYLYERIQRWRGCALAELDRFPEALPILREAISYPFDSADEEHATHLWLAVCLEETGDFESAKPELTRLIEVGVKNSIAEHARYRLSRLYFRSGAFARAVQQLEIIVQDHPQGDFVIAKKELYDGLSQCYRQLGDAVKSEQYRNLATRRRYWPWRRPRFPVE